MLDSDPRRRPTAEEVLQHPWMQKTANLSRRPMVHAAENLRGFHRGRMRLKACLLAVMSGLAGPETYGGDPDATVGSRTGALKWMDVDGKVRAEGNGGREGAGVRDRAEKRGEVYNRGCQDKMFGVSLSFFCSCCFLFMYGSKCGARMIVTPAAAGVKETLLTHPARVSTYAVRTRVLLLLNCVILAAAWDTVTAGTAADDDDDDADVAGTFHVHTTLLPFCRRGR